MPTLRPLKDGVHLQQLDRDHAVSLKEYKDHLREEWALYKRHPIMFMPWVILLYAVCDAFFK